MMKKWAALKKIHEETQAKLATLDDEGIIREYNRVNEQRKVLRNQYERLTGICNEFCWKSRFLNPKFARVENMRTRTFIKLSYNIAEYNIIHDNVKYSPTLRFNGNGNLVYR